MPNTTQQAESSIWVEQPVISARCPHCNDPVKSSLNPSDEPVFLSAPYRILIIRIFSGGRSFEKVAIRFLHICRPSLKDIQTPPNGVGHSLRPELALL